MKRFLVSLLLLPFLFACSKLTHRFINHPRPDFSLDSTAFENAGCPPDKYGYRNCTPDSPLYALGCEQIQQPSDLLGALEPTYPIALCITHWDQVIVAINEIENALHQQCQTSPEDVCATLQDTIAQICVQPYSQVCSAFEQALEEKCQALDGQICQLDDRFREACENSPDIACNFFEEIHETRMLVQDEYAVVEHPFWPDYQYEPQGKYFFMNGGIALVAYRYVIFQDDQFVLIETEDQFRQIFAPIESQDEALGYVKAVTGLADYYGLKFDWGYTYFADVIEDTHAKEVEGGYQVRLYSDERFGCGSHPSYAVDFYITPQGYVQQIGMEKAFQERSKEGWCVD